MIISVSTARKFSAVAVAPTPIPRRMVTILMSSFCIVFERRSMTPLSRARFPSISIPTSGAAAGIRRTTSIVTAIGKIIFSFFDTGLSCSITASRSFFVVRSFIIGGCITGTRAMYEYAATAIAPSRWGASFVAVKIAVGPSAPPMIPIAPASKAVKPRNCAPMNVKKIPNCAAAPRRNVLGLAINGPKSFIAPTPMKMRGGNMPVFIPI